MSEVELQNITDYIDYLYNTYDIGKLEKSFNDLIAKSEYRYTKYSVESSGRTFECRLFDTQDPVHVIRQFAVLQDIMFGDPGAEKPKVNNNDLLDDFLEICFLATTNKTEDGKVKKDEASFKLVHDAWAIAKIIGNKNKSSTQFTVDKSTVFDKLSIERDEKGNPSANKNIYTLKHGSNDINLEGRHFKLMVAYNELPSTEQEKDTVQILVYNFHKDLIANMLNKIPSPFPELFDRNLNSINVNKNLNSTPTTGGKPVKKSKKTKKTKNPTRRI